MKKDTFGSFWDEIVSSAAHKLECEFDGVSFDKSSKDNVMQEYDKINNYCKKTYMENPKGLLDRHKICATIICAIIRVRPMLYDPESHTENNSDYCNERLAISAALSLLRALAMSAADETEKKDEWHEKLKDGIKIPPVNHGKGYIENFCAELRFTENEKNYNILSLANTLFLLENITIHCS